MEKINITPPLAHKRIISAVFLLFGGGAGGSSIRALIFRRVLVGLFEHRGTFFNTNGGDSFRKWQKDRIIFYSKWE